MARYVRRRASRRKQLLKKQQAVHQQRMDALASEQEHDSRSLAEHTTEVAVSPFASHTPAALVAFGGLGKKVSRGDPTGEGWGPAGVATRTRAL